jgi:hypothetical protein
MKNITGLESMHKCAFEQCQCQIPFTEEYCSDSCSDADDVAEVEIQCNCEHSSCGLERMRVGLTAAAEANAIRGR